MDKSPARLKWLPTPDGPITVHHRRDVSAVETGEVHHFGHHHECAPGIASPSYSPADLIRVSILVRQPQGQSVDVRLRVRASDGVAAREILFVDFSVPAGEPVNLAEIRGFLTQNPYEVFIHHRDGAPIVFDYWVGVGYCCGRPSIVVNDEIPRQVGYTAIPPEGSLDLSPLALLLNQISNNQLSGAQLARIYGESRQGGSYFDQVAGVIRVNDGANDVWPRGALAAESPYRAGAWLLFGSTIAGPNHSFIVPAATRVQRVVVRTGSATGQLRLDTTYQAPVIVSVPSNANLTTYEFAPGGRAGPGVGLPITAVQATNLGSLGMLWVELTKDP